MDRRGRGEVARLIGAVRRDRAGLLVTSALTAAVLGVVTLPARAQPAPDTQPTGGVVVAGSARIAATPTTTTVTQSSSRAAVNWQSFNVGSRATVNFVQPSASAVTLNRVLAPDPSVIAGHIHANGGIVITNRSGVVFTHGSEVNAASVLVSAAGITNRNFMAGRMQFDIPAKPGARIVNAGHITVQAAGLAALVAPEVANSGVITATLGHVVLAGGAAAETLDLYGDGLVSLDVTPETHQVRLSNGTKATALVTNTGTILAGGGTVQLTARQADGLVQDLVDAGGTIAANSLSAHAGTIAITGVGGSIRIPGTLLAAGTAPGTTGGAIALDATGTVALASGARIDASGAAGGGTVAIGTTLARARGGPGAAATLTASAVAIAPDARIAADATDNGNGGRVTVLSQNTTTMAGTITARGGPHGGNGGSAEISGQNLSLSGGVDVSAPLGVTGSILLDPTNLKIVATGADDATDVTTSPVNGVAYGVGGANDTVSASAIEGLSGNVTLQATNNLEIATNLALTGTKQSLTLQAGSDLIIDSGFRVSATGGIEMDAAFAFGTIAANPAGAITVNGTVSATDALTLSAGTGGISVPGSISGSALSLTTGGPIVVDGKASTSSGGALNLTSSAGGIAVSGTLNPSGGLTLNAGTGGISIATAGTIHGSALSASAAGLIAIDGKASTSSGGALSLTSSAGGIAVGGALNASGGLTLSAGTGGISIASAGTIHGSSLSLTGGNGILIGGAASTNSGGHASFDGGASAINITGSISAGGVTLTTTGAAIEAGAGAITASTLTGSATSAGLTGANHIDSLVGFTASGGDFSLTEATGKTLAVTGEVSVPGGGTIALTADRITIGNTLLTGSASAPDGTVTLAPASAIPIELRQAGAASGGTLSLNQAELNRIKASTLQIGSANAGPITIKGAVTFAGISVLDLLSSGALSETAGDSLSIGTLAGDVASANLIGTLNAIGTLGKFTVTNGAFSLTNQQALGIAGAVSLVGNAATFTINGGGLSESGSGTLSAGTLTASVATGNQISLIDNNAIGTLGAITATGGFTLTDTEPLKLTGLIDAGTSGTVQLNDPGSAISEPGGTIEAALFTGSAASATLSGDNQIGTLANFTATGGDFSLTEAAGQALAVTGAVSVPGGGTIALTTDTLAINGGMLAALGGTVQLAPSSPTNAVALIESGTTNPGTLAVTNTDLGAISAKVLQVGTLGGEPITVTGAIALPHVDLLDLVSGGALSETTADSLSVGTLAADVASASLIGTLNAIGTLGDITAHGGFTLTDSEPLKLTGLVDAGTSGTVQLNDPGFAITGQGGSITAGSLGIGLPAAAVQSATLTGNNVIGTLDAVTVSGGFTLTDSEPLKLTGLVDAGTSGTVQLNDPGFAITEQGGSITAGSLGIGLPAAAVQSATLTGNNVIGTLDAVTVSGGFTLTDAKDLALAGLVDAGTSGTVQLNDPGFAISETTGSVTAGTLSGSAATVSLPNNANVIGTLGTFSAPGGLTLATANGLAISGRVSTGSAGINFTSGGSITEIAGGTLIGAELTGFAGGGTLTRTAGTASFANTNTLGALGSFTALGGFTLADTGNLALLGPLDAGSSTVLLTGGATVTEPSGSIIAATLSGVLASAALGGANRISDLANFSAANGFSLTNLGALTLTGPVNSGSAEAFFMLGGNLVQTGAGILTTGTLAGSATLIDLTAPANRIASLGALSAPGGLMLATATDLTIAGIVATGSAPISLQGAADITEGAGGTLVAGALSGSANAASFANTNSIAELGSFTAPGGFTLDNGGDLPIAGPLDAGLSTVLLIAGGSLYETTATILGETTLGSITAGTLTGRAGSVALDGSGENRIANLGPFTAGAFNLNDGENLAVIGTVTGNPIELDVNGNLALGGAAGSGVLSSSGAVFLTATGAITEPAGAIDAAILTGNAASASLGGANLVPLLGRFTTTGLFLLRTAGPALTVNGPLAAGSASLITAGSLALAGVVSARAATLNAGGAIAEPGGVIAAGTLAGSAAAATLTAANSIATLGSFTTPGTFLLTDTQPLAVAGPVTAPFFGISDSSNVSFTGAIDVGTLNITAAGSITEPSGAVTAALLEGSANGLAQLGPDAPAGSASIATLGPFSVANGTFSLTDSVPLNIIGPLSANDFAIAAPGSIVLTNATITTIGLPVAQQSNADPARPGSYFDVITPAGRFLALGRTTINPAGGPATVRIQLNPGGKLISFADLVAPTTSLILDTGAGDAVGTIDLGALIVIGNLGSSNLTGTISNLAGVVASSKATISPFQSAHYRLNSCPLMSVNCIFIAPPEVPQGNPLSGIAIVSARPNQRDLELLLPNVAAKDY